ncbi:hypothetical protein Pmani_003813 [Petrolisthes manimaculis]|uniref:Uncharacterized protein n=1 Tax=Petrolisthes manimaculis TaxID=1843537 RepID=A0AAE1QF91_9EUCA|nr:hypothetical protein Pmani_003813 [Petrolisthes manimaculis]
MDITSLLHYTHTYQPSQPARLHTHTPLTPSQTSHTNTPPSSTQPDFSHQHSTLIHPARLLTPTLHPHPPSQTSHTNTPPTPTVHLHLARLLTRQHSTHIHTPLISGETSPTDQLR